MTVPWFVICNAHTQLLMPEGYTKETTLAFPARELLLMSCCPFSQPRLPTCVLPNRHMQREACLERAQGPLAPNSPLLNPFGFIGNMYAM